MYNYTQLKRFHNECRPQFYIYAFKYVDLQKMLVEDHFTDTKTFAVKYKEISTKGPVPKDYLGFSYIHSEDYDIDKNFDDTQLKNLSENTSNNKVIFFAKLLW